MLDGRHNVIAYLPLKNFQERICGRPDVKTDDLKSITKYDYKPRNRELEQWFWEVFEKFD